MRYEYVFPLVKYLEPIALTRDMKSNNIKHYIYGIFMLNEAPTVIKYGQGTGDRVGRQVEGLRGWGRGYGGCAAKKFRNGLITNGLYDNHRDKFVIVVDDYTEEYLDIAFDHGLTYANAFITNKERDEILSMGVLPPLNQQVPRRQVEYWEDAIREKMYNSLFEDAA